MERDDFQKLKTINELDPDEIVANLEYDIEEYTYEAQGRPDDYIMGDHILPKYRAAFLQRVVDLIESLQNENRQLRTEKAEMVEKFAERAKEEAFTVFMGEPIIRASKIDEICKEFIGESKNV